MRPALAQLVGFDAQTVGAVVGILDLSPQCHGRIR